MRWQFDDHMVSVSVSAGSGVETCQGPRLGLETRRDETRRDRPVSRDTNSVDDVHSVVNLRPTDPAVLRFLRGMTGFREARRARH